MTNKIHSTYIALKQEYKNLYLTKFSWQVEITGYLRSRNMLSADEDKLVWDEVGKYISNI